MVDGIYFFSTFPEGPKGLTVPVLFTQAHTLMVALLLNSGTNLYPPEVMWGSVSGQVTWERQETKLTIFHSEVDRSTYAALSLSGVNHLKKKSQYLLQQALITNKSLKKNVAPIEAAVTAPSYKRTMVQSGPCISRRQETGLYTEHLHWLPLTICFFLNNRRSYSPAKLPATNCLKCCIITTFCQIRLYWTTLMTKVRTFTSFYRHFAHQSKLRNQQVP